MQGDIGAAVAAVAERYVGIREIPAGSNRGEHIDRWNREVGNPIGSPWCAAFACCAAREAGVEHGPWTGSSGEVANWGERTGSGVSGGDVCAGCLGAVINPETATGHCHTVVAVSGPDSDGVIDTVEGNEGNAVRRNRRHADTVDWVVPWGPE
ncbi:MAG: hypothetical protein KGJ62_15455 [Armatimonadetes bacterium]|nr:hypothetical protein [Armatimonadota bacterium]MDE2207480.1 hypothetical protein [Armatimonadota bacterium]